MVDPGDPGFRVRFAVGRGGIREDIKVGRDESEFLKFQFSRMESGWSQPALLWRPGS